MADPARSASTTVTVSAGQAIVLADRVPMPASGGEILVSQPGSPLDGLAIQVPEDAFSTGTEWTVVEQPDLTPPLPEGFAQVGPAFRVRNGQGFADDMFLLKIPVDVEEEQVPVAFFYDPATGHMELIPPVQFGEEDDRLWVMTRHVSTPNLLLPPSGGTPAPARSGHGPSEGPQRTSPAFGEITIVIVAPSEEGLLGTFSTSFQPGVDDWEFPNHGSYLTPHGFCAGSVISAMYHHYFRKASEGPLNGLYDEIIDSWEDNGRGIRLASVVQASLDWGAYLRHIGDFAIPIEGGYTFPYVHAISLATSLKVTGLPQLVGIHTAEWRAGHALTVYGFQDGVFMVADPNAPGESREIRWGGGHWVWGGDWEPFNFSPRVDAPMNIYTRVLPVGVSSLVDIEALAGYWRQFEDGTIGDAEFPDKTVQYRNPSVSPEWRTVKDTVRTAGDTLDFRWLCHSCPWSRELESGDPRQLTMLVGPGPAGLLLAEDSPGDVEGATLVPDDGHQKVGVLNGAMRLSPYNEWSFTNFDWITVQRMTFEVTADNEAPGVDEDVTFTVEGDGLEYVVPRLRWDFGDGTELETSDVYEVVHAYSDTGAHEVTVELLDEDGVPVARAQVQIGSPAEAWVGEVTYVVQSSSQNDQRERRFEATGLRFEPAETSPAGMRRFQAVAGEVSFTASGGNSWCTYTGVPATTPVTNGDLYLRTDDDTGSGATMWHAGRGTFSPPFVVTVVEDCDGFDPLPLPYTYDVWFRTMPGSTWDWLEYTDPDLLEGTVSIPSGTWTHTWTWRFERLRGPSEP